MRLLGLALMASCVESQDGIILGRVTLFDQWFRRTEHTRAHTSRHTDGKAGPDAPEAWTVRSKRDVVRGELIYNKAKRVRRGTTVQGNVSVVIKGVGRHDVAHSSNRGGSESAAWKLNLTPSTRVVSIRRGRGWSIFRF